MDDDYNGYGFTDSHSHCQCHYILDDDDDYPPIPGFFVPSFVLDFAKEMIAKS
ncbi:hypothetical protein A2U01_0102282, partial [Trifolium medium]|nr:hypothetical protein [Trifolium medium]